MDSKKSKNKGSNKKISRRDFIQLLGKTTGFMIALPVLETVRPLNKTYTSNTSDLVLLKNGFIVDGTGKEGFLGSLLIKNGKIEKILKEEVSYAGAVLDCSNKVIAPGFIDAHSHMDWVLHLDGKPELKTPFTAQGITSFVGGNCGYGVAGFRKNSSFKSMIEEKGLFSSKLQWDTMEEYFSYLQKHPMSHNLINLAGHGMTRTSIRGFEPTPMKPEEMKEMLYLLEEAMDEGARGVSLGLQYEPGLFATADELKQVAELVKKKDKILTVHKKAYSKLSATYPIKPFIGKAHNLIALKEMLDLSRETGVRLQLSHLIFVGSKTWKTYDNALEMIDDAIKDGVDVKFDTYAYHCGVSHINVFFPDWFLARVPEVYDDKSAIRKIRLQAKVAFPLIGFGYKDIQITYAFDPELNKYNGMFASDIAKERGISNFDNLLEFARRSNGKARVLNHNYTSPEIVDELMKHPASLFMTDAWVNTEGVQNPAAFGNHPRILQMAREKSLISLEEAIHKMTGAVAERFQVNDRGMLKEGLAADITIFDWNNIKDNNTTTETNKAPSGIETVFINGHQVLSQGKVDGSMNAGMVVI